jgi:hypothetical protein
MQTNTHFWSYLVQFFLEREMFQTKVVQKIKTHFFQLIFFENRTVCEITWKNSMVHALACWITKATDTHRTHNSNCFSRATMVTWTRLTVAFVSTLPILLLPKHHTFSRYTRKCNSIYVLSRSMVFLAPIFIKLKSSDLLYRPSPK